MTVIFVASIVAWARAGNTQLKENWTAGRNDSSTQGIAHQMFNGFCIGVLGLTGFECKLTNAHDLSHDLPIHILCAGIPSYVSHFKAGIFPKVLRNLHYPAIILNAFSMLFLLALVPYDTIVSGTNVLSALAEVVSA